MKLKIFFTIVLLGGFLSAMEHKGYKPSQKQTRANVYATSSTVKGRYKVKKASPTTTKEKNKTVSSADPKEWLAFARQECAASRALIEATYPLLRPALYQAQQCAEKSLKAYLVYQGKQFERIHNLKKLLNCCKECDQEFGKFYNALVKLSNLAAGNRYPDCYGSKTLDYEIVSEHVINAKELMEFVHYKVN